MLVIMENGATEAHVKAVIREIETMGYHGISIPGIRRTAVCIVGNQDTVEDSRLLALEGVKETIHVTKPFKPRTSPYSFQGLGEKGLKLLKKVREETGLAIITEATDCTNIELVEQYADIIQIGAGNMHNDPLHALSDGMQSLYPEQFATLMKEIRSLAV